MIKIDVSDYVTVQVEQIIKTVDCLTKTHKYENQVLETQVQPATNNNVP